MTNAVEAAVLRALAWFMAVGYPPLEEELARDVDIGPHWQGGVPSAQDAAQALAALVPKGAVVVRGRRCVLPGHEGLFAELRVRERYFPRKWRRIQRLVRWMRLLPSVRFVAVCNTTALGAARDEADIDLFLIVRAGTVWLTRGLVSLLAAAAFRRPNQSRGERDALCFSFFIDDADLSLRRFSLEEDPYLRFWIRHLLPVLDDGIGTRLWDEQAWSRAREPFAVPWLAWRTMPSRHGSVPAFVVALDRLALKLQRAFGSKALWVQADRPGTEVVLDAHTFKAHIDDRRAEFRETYEAICKRIGVDA